MVLNGSFNKLEILHKSKSSSIVKCTIKDSDKIVVLKIYDFLHSRWDIIKIINEIRISTMLHHHNIIKTLSYFEDIDKICIVQEYAHFGDLYYYKKSFEHERIPEKIAASQFIYQLIEAIIYMHSKNIIHCDIKPENVLVTNNGTPKLCDFGLSIDKTMNINYYMHRGGTLDFMAPELINFKYIYNEKIDVWAMGCLTYELIYGDPPFRSVTSKETEYKIVETVVIFLDNVVLSENCKSFILSLLQKDYTLRPSAVDCLKFKYLNLNEEVEIEKDDKTSKCFKLLCPTNNKL